MPPRRPRPGHAHPHRRQAAHRGLAPPTHTRPSARLSNATPPAHKPRRTRPQRAGGRRPPPPHLQEAAWRALMPSRGPGPHAPAAARPSRAARLASLHDAHSARPPPIAAAHSERRRRPARPPLFTAAASGGGAATARQRHNRITRGHQAPHGAPHMHHHTRAFAPARRPAEKSARTHANTAHATWLRGAICGTCRGATRALLTKGRHTPRLARVRPSTRALARPTVTIRPPRGWNHAQTRHRMSAQQEHGARRRPALEGGRRPASHRACEARAACGARAAEVHSLHGLGQMGATDNQVTQRSCQTPQ